MVVERGNFINLGHGEIHLLGKGYQMPIMQTAEGVIQGMEVLDEQVPRKGTPVKRQPNFGHGRILGLAALKLALPTDALAHFLDRGKRLSERGKGRSRHRRTKSIEKKN
jgi:hypothetical protein